VKACLEKITINNGLSIVNPFDVFVRFALNVLLGRVMTRWDLDYHGVLENEMMRYENGGGAESSSC
jgi:hypothetical protein